MKQIRSKVNGHKPGETGEEYEIIRGSDEKDPPTNHQTAGAARKERILERVEKWAGKIGPYIDFF